MKRTRTLLILGALSLLAVGCGLGAGDTIVQSATENPSLNTISVGGSGEVMGKPDTVIIDIGVSVVRADVGTATTDGAAAARRLIDALISEGVAEDDIQTANYSLNPEYDYTTNVAKIIGYRVSNLVTAKVRDIETAGAVIDAATKAGGNDAVVNGVRFDIEDNGELIAAARAAAWDDAKAKAEQLASLSERTLGLAVTITESVSEGSGPVYYGRESLDAGAETPIQPGQQSVTVVIQVVFSIS